MSEPEKNEQEKNEVPVIPPRVVSINQGFYDLPREERRELLRNLILSLSPNEEVRKKAQEEAKRPKNQA